MFRVEVSGHSLLVHRGPLPEMYASYRQHSALTDEFALDKSEGETCVVAVGRPGEWPSLVVAQRFSPCSGGFDPGVLLVPETGVLFIGAGERLLAYNLQGPKRLWEDQADTGFWSWQQHGNFVLMAAELELAAWDTNGKKCWTTFIEPPWTYRVDGDQVHLDVMGVLSTFPLEDGPSINPR